jgi:hypothetical protein
MTPDDYGMCGQAAESANSEISTRAAAASEAFRKLAERAGPPAPPPTPAEQMAEQTRADLAAGLLTPAEVVTINGQPARLTTIKGLAGADVSDMDLGEINAQIARNRKRPRTGDSVTAWGSRGWHDAS